MLSHLLGIFVWQLDRSTELAEKYISGRLTLVWEALSLTHELSFLSFYQSTVLSSRAVDGHQMYFGGSIVGKASTIGIEISPILPLIFTGSKSAKFGVIFNIIQLWAARI